MRVAYRLSTLVTLSAAQLCGRGRVVLLFVARCRSSGLDNGANLQPRHFP